MEKQFYYADANSQPVGPLSLDEIRRFAEAGVVPSDVMVCEAGGEDWILLSSLVAPKSSPPRKNTEKSSASPASREKPRHVSMELSDSENTPAVLRWGCNVALPTVIGIGAAIFFLVKLFQSLGVIDR